MRARCVASLVWLLPSLAAAQLPVIRPDPIEPSRWAESTGDDCYSRGRGRDGVIAQARICDGPRRVPLPDGEAAERAERLGLGTRPAADRLRIGTPPDEWLAELEGVEPREDLLWPVARGLFSRGFGRVRRAEIRHRPHNGVDIVAEPGAHIRAVNDALVVYADNHVRGYGNFLVLLHADGSASLYGHCRAILVAPGQLVARGQLVAEVGATGRPVIAHLHFEWRHRGVPRDPMGAFVERPDSSEIRPDGTPESTVPPPPNAVGSGGGSEEEARRDRDVAEGVARGSDPRGRSRAEEEDRAAAHQDARGAEAEAGRAERARAPAAERGPHGRGPHRLLRRDRGRAAAGREGASVAQEAARQRPGARPGPAADDLG